MGLTLGEVKQKALKLIDEYSINGSIISENKNADYTSKMNDLADTSQQELSQRRKIKAKYEFVQNTIWNLVANSPGYDFNAHLDQDITYIALGAKAYYFEVDNPAIIYLEEQVDGEWKTLKTITATDNQGFRAYKGAFLKYGLENEVRLRFSGDFIYNIRNIALYKYAFPNDDAVPPFLTKIRYTMPEDFAQLDNIILENDRGQYGHLMNYHWENDKELLIDYRYRGRVVINYFKKPSRITNSTPDSYEFEIDYTVANLIPYYIASIVKNEESPQTFNIYRSLYENGIMNLEPQQHDGIMVIEDINNW